MARMLSPTSDINLLCSACVRVVISVKNVNMDSDFVFFVRSKDHLIKD